MSVTRLPLRHNAPAHWYAAASGQATKPPLDTNLRDRMPGPAEAAAALPNQAVGDSWPTNQSKYKPTSCLRPHAKGQCQLHSHAQARTTAPHLMIADGAVGSGRIASVMSRLAVAVTASLIVPRKRCVFVNVAASCVALLAQGTRRRAAFFPGPLLWSFGVMQRLWPVMQWTAAWGTGTMWRHRGLVTMRVVFFASPTTAHASLVLLTCVRVR